MRRWWSGLPMERYWLEVTNRDDIGGDLRAPSLGKNGKPYWGHQLLRHLEVGDMVFHYDTNKHAIVCSTYLDYCRIYHRTL